MKKKDFKRWMMVIPDVIAIAFLAALAWSVVDALDVLKLNEKTWIVHGPVSFYLPDSSRVVLDRGATLISDTGTYGMKNREVMLTGRAFYQVRSDCSRPFIVHSRKATVQVLGTSFVVNAAPAKQETRVTVSTGKVNVSYGSLAEDLIPNEQIVLNNTSGTLLKSKVLADTAQAWASEFVDLIFIEEALQRVAKKFRVRVTIEDEALKKRTIDASFLDKEDVLEDALTSMEWMTHARFIVKDGIVTMRKPTSAQPASN